MPRRRILIFIAAAALLTGAAIWMIGTRAEQPTASTLQVNPEKPADHAEKTIHSDIAIDSMATADEHAIATGHDSAPEPLPNEGTAVAEVYDTLHARAQRGDAHAACWLGQELQRCARARNTRLIAGELERRTASEQITPDNAVRAITFLENRSRQLADGCESLTPEQLDQAFELRLQAAQNLPELRVSVALDPALDTANFLADLDRWADYRRVALPWLEQAAREGDAPALIAISRVFGDHRRLQRINPPFRIRDDRRFVLYTDLMARYGIVFPAAQADLDAARARLTPDQQAQVTQEVGQLYKPEIASFDKQQGQMALRQSMSPESTTAVCE